MQKEEIKALFNSHLSRNVVFLYKQFLILLETNQTEHKSMIRKLKAAIPREYHSIIDSADYFDEQKFSYLRKRILDYGNETIREVEKSIQNFSIDLKG